MEIALAFLHLVLIGFVALIPPVNPVGTALIIDPMLSGLDPAERRAAAKRIAFYCFVISCASVGAGSWIMKLFGISLPIVQLAGGILICRMGWDLLTSDTSVAKESGDTITDEHQKVKTSKLLFYPIAFPMTTGAGTISVLLTLSARGESEIFSEYVNNLGALFIAIAMMCLVIYWCYAFTPLLIKRLGSRGEEIMNRLSAFLVFCVGLQIGVGGLMHIIKG